MKRLVLIASLLGFAVCMNPAIAKDTSEHLTAQQNNDGKKKLTQQQEKMVKCSKEAKEKALKGELRKKFMSDCLKN